MLQPPCLQNGRLGWMQESLADRISRIQGCQQPELPQWPQVSLLTSRGPASIPRIPAPCWEQQE